MINLVFGTALKHNEFVRTVSSAKNQLVNSLGIIQDIKATHRISIGESSIGVVIGDSSWSQWVYFQGTDDPDHLYTYPGSRGTYC